jgi:hypothetical protein
MAEEVISKVIPKRPGRIYPRTVKQWRKRYPMAVRGKPRQKSIFDTTVSVLKKERTLAYA